MAKHLDLYKRTGQSDIPMIVPVFHFFEALLSQNVLAGSLCSRRGSQYVLTGISDMIICQDCQDTVWLSLLSGYSSFSIVSVQSTFLRDSQYVLTEPQLPVHGATVLGSQYVLTGWKHISVTANVTIDSIHPISSQYVLTGRYLPCLSLTADVSQYVLTGQHHLSVTAKVAIDSIRPISSQYVLTGQHQSCPRLATHVSQYVLTGWKHLSVTRDEAPPGAPPIHSLAPPGPSRTRHPGAQKQTPERMQIPRGFFFAFDFLKRNDDDNPH